MIALALSDLDIAGRLATAGLTGLAVGIEREWSGHASGPQARFAGVRTFLLLGLVGGIGGAVAAAIGWAGMAGTLIGGAAALAVVAYAIASVQTRDRDGTTETAALLVLGTGVLCGLGHGRLGSGVAVVAALALAEKGRIQQWVGQIGRAELQSVGRSVTRVASG
ncbi:MAG TPA: MgtC/SapB family protein [Gemmatimonadales bacterium]|nr:MgtC/SapB family protein [Gemmatimonadales bacterium]